MSSSPWAKIQKVEPVNLKDIMSEEVAKDMQQKENRRYMESLNQTHCQNDISEAECSADGYCESDEVIAHMLQKQFDKEYDEMLQRTENKFNGDSKVSVSFRKYKRSESAADSDESDDELVDIIDRKDWDRFDNVKRSLMVMPRCGYMKSDDGNVITKHDMTLSGRNNTYKLMSFPPEFHTGDGAGFDIQLSNKVFNKLRAHSKNEQARRYKIHDKREDRATAEFGVDEFTKLILYKMVNSGMLERVNGIISTGKEAVILHAESDPTYTKTVLPKECVIKVFKTTLSEFKHRDRYIKDDSRFKDRFCKLNSRKMVMLWAEKEMQNLTRLAKAGIPCPKVIALKKHVLVMSFIGNKHRAAPKLKDVLLNQEDMILVYDQVVDVMKKLYNDAKLIHADLSEYNILVHDGQCWFIDVGQSIEPSHPNAHLFLYRDCANVSTFFTKNGVPEVKNPNALFSEIAGYEYHSEYPATVSKDNQKLKPHLFDRPDIEISTNFDYEWEKSKINVNNIADVNTKTNNLILVDSPALKYELDI